MPCAPIICLTTPIISLLYSLPAFQTDRVLRMDFNSLPATSSPANAIDAWRTPSLVCFGTVQALTAGGSNYEYEADPNAPDNIRHLIRP